MGIGWPFTTCCLSKKLTPAGCLFSSCMLNVCVCVCVCVTAGRAVGCVLSKQQ
jgi:hypothetical protein